MANEYNIISDEALDALCGAIKGIANAGEILDDTGVAMDKTYSSFKIQEELDKKIGKDNLVTVLDNTVTDEDIPSAKASYNLFKIFNTKINGDAVKTDILSYAENLTSRGFYPIQLGSVSETNVPYQTFSYTNGFIMRTGATKDNSRITVVLFPRSGSDLMGDKIAINTKYNSDNWMGWKYYGSSTVADVPVTSINIINGMNNPVCNYQVKNGICYIQFNSGKYNLGENVDGLQLAKNMPIPASGGVYHTYLPFPSNDASKQVLVSVDGNGSLLLHAPATANGCPIFCTFSYPVKE